jgi:hypothetical protein
MAVVQNQTAERLAEFAAAITRSGRSSIMA